MRSPRRWLQRRLELHRHSTRRKQVAQRFAAHLGHPIKLVPASTKGGYDEIYYALRDRTRFAVVRINSEHKADKDPIGDLDPGIPLNAQQRLDREWEAYSRLAPLGLSPTPLWRDQGTIACEWLDWERASRQLTRQRSEIWELLAKIFPLVNHMHAAGVTHLDLNLGNLLLDPETGRLVVIDFEFGPRPWVSTEQQQAFDYLRVIDDCTKPRRGGRLMLADLPRLIALLQPWVDASTGLAETGFVLEKLRRLDSEPELLTALQQVFPGLRRAPQTG